MKWAFKHILRKLKSEYNYYPQICHVHTHTFYEDKAAQIFHSFFPRTPMVFTLHAIIPYIRLSTNDKRRLLYDEMTPDEVRSIRKLYRGREKSQEGMIKLANKVIAISQVHKDAFDRIYPEYVSKCVCIPNGTDFGEYAELKKVKETEKELRARIAPNGERIIVFVGRIEAQKGSRALCLGFNEIARKHGDVKLVLVGADPVEKEKLLSAGLDKKYLNRAHFAGWIKDKEVLAAYYRLADAMVQPVFSKDLYAMVALEAMLLKPPVISCPGKLTLGHCNSPQHIVRAFEKIFHDPEAVKRHVEEVKEQVEADYSLGAVYHKHIKLYRSL